MLINELEANVEITIEVRNAETGIELKTKIIDLASLTKDELASIKEYAGKTVLMPYAIAEKINFGSTGVSFKGTDYHMKVQAPKGSRMYVWKDIQIFGIRLKSGKVLQLVATATEAKELNRRKAYRVYIGKEGMALIGNNNKPRSVTVKDISATGIGVIIENFIDPVEPHTDIHVTFEYTTDVKDKFSIHAEVLTCIPMGEGRHLLGCTFKKYSQAIERFVSKVQAAERRRASGMNNRPR